MNHFRKALVAFCVALVLGIGIAWAAPSKDRIYVYNRSTSLSANTDALSTDVTPAVATSLLRVWVVPGTASVFNCTLDNGTTTKTVGLNASAALNAGDQYVFDIPSVHGLTYNFQFETTQSTGYTLLFVQEIQQ